MLITTTAFYLFAAVLTLSALMVISARNPVHAVLFLILAFFNAAGLFVMLGAEFLAMILVIVYVGAVAVLFLFVVMMLNINAEELRKGFMRHLPVGIGVGVVLFAQLAFVLTGAFAGADALAGAAQPLGQNRVQNPVPEGMGNTAALGAILYTKYAYLFQACGLVLLTAMIGAIVLTLRPRQPGTLRQDIGTQIARARTDAVSVLPVKTGEGVTL